MVAAYKGNSFLRLGGLCQLSLKKTLEDCQSSMPSNEQAGKNLAFQCCAKMVFRCLLCG